ncbi:MAG TPA: FliA/WhiG family RNA polymerase sigma factor [Thermodesulfobacteriota bacterium]|nr:FliA/WhiG family RNA polymerase sigma factor [Deltaproteobacteria bacterium]HNU70247.1 FliA/WhiG family RNA polymerase sigma factor [Thermodesulfobacteriota bacterium]HOC37910.1 FliA/WhiG family RNA polymerase sigma factor [Thermodesulfobacteriota bacterium]HQO78476.1 FliA/WhiG family RNA polymerase sigma factor [Thermodesulfobacteriota bacterium]
MGQVLKKVSKHPEEESLHSKLLKEYLPYVKRIVYRIAVHLPSHLEMDDLVSAGIVGLMEAIEKYDPQRDNKFLTYAIFRIRGAVLSELRSQDFHSRANRRKVRELERAYLKLEQRLGREVYDEEVALELGLQLEEFYQVKKMSGISFISLEDVGVKASEEREKLLSFFVDRENFDALAWSRVREIEAAVERTIEQLPEKERMVITLYYWEELTMKEIGKILDITESRVSQLHSQAVIHLRARLQKEGLIDG